MPSIEVVAFNAPNGGMIVPRCLRGVNRSNHGDHLASFAHVRRSIREVVEKLMFYDSSLIMVLTIFENNVIVQQPLPVLCLIVTNANSSSSNNLDTRPLFSQEWFGLIHSASFLQCTVK
jgi:hypothetical protein